MRPRNLYKLSSIFLRKTSQEYDYEYLENKPEYDDFVQEGSPTYNDLTNVLNKYFEMREDIALKLKEMRKSLINLYKESENSLSMVYVADDIANDLLARENPNIHPSQFPSIADYVKVSDNLAPPNVEDLINAFDESLRQLKIKDKSTLVNDVLEEIF